jgi:hypothetical protein
MFWANSIQKSLILSRANGSQALAWTQANETLNGDPVGPHFGARGSLCDRQVSNRSKLPTQGEQR